MRGRATVGRSGRTRGGPGNRIVFVCQVVDPDDPVLGNAISLIQELARQADEVVVVANEVRRVPADLGVEVRSLGKERGRGRLVKAVAYEAILGDVLRRLRPATVVAHMCPTYLTMASPLVRATGGRSVLWYAHASDSASLGRAHRRADAVLTTFAGTYPRPGPKVRVIGQAIDTAQYQPRPRPSVASGGDGGGGGGGGLQLVAVGRVAPAKQYQVLLRGLAGARRDGVDARLQIVGPCQSASDRAHRAQLDGLVAELGLAEVVAFAPEVPPAAVAGVLTGADVLANTTVAGSADKAVFEAMACGVPALASSPPFRELLDGEAVALAFPDGDAEALAARIVGLARAGPAIRAEVGLALRAKVEQHHSLRHWAGEVVRVAAELGAEPVRSPRRRVPTS